MVIGSRQRITTSIIRNAIWSLALLGWASSVMGAFVVGKGQEELLSPDKAFALSTRVIDANTLEAHWEIAKGYYLYKSKFKFKLVDGAVKLGKPVLPKGKKKQDQFFGKIEIYTKSITARIPLKRNQTNAETIKLRLSWQGCNDPVGVCYQPASKTVSFNLPAVATTDASTFTNTSSLKSLSNLIDKQRLGEKEFLPPDQAFRVSAEINRPGIARIDFYVTPGYYLYKNKIKITGNGVGAYTLPKGKMKDDPLFGKIETYSEPVFVDVPLAGTGPFKLNVAYQGCADKGICYPPAKKTFELKAVNAGTGPSNPSAEVSKSSSGVYMAAISGAFIIGLLLTFTPCVLPMIPILSSVIVGQGGDKSKLRGGLLAGIYVLGTAVTYTAAGILAGASGDQLQAYFQNVWAIGIFSAILVLLALSMFGFYELQMPASIQSRLHMHSSKIKGGSFIGVFILGLISALIVGACVSPLLISALGVAIASKDSVLGGLIMFSMAMGMGVVLVAIGFGAGFLLPKAGVWMDRVKHFFGIMLLGVAIYLLGLLPQVPVLFLWAILLIVTSIYFGATQSLPEKTNGWRYFWKGLGTVMLVWGVLALIGAMSGNRDIMRPVSLSSLGLSSVSGPSSPRDVYGEAHLFEQVKTVAQLETKLDEAKAKGQPVIVDFFATWCTDCLRMEETTFKDPQVRNLMKNKFMSLQIDVTDINNKGTQAIKKHLGVFGPPAMLFIDGSGKERKDLNFYGYKSAKELVIVFNSL